MTPAQQKRFYFPAWAACAAANGWKMAAGRLAADLTVQRAKYSEEWPATPGEGTEPTALALYLQVVEMAYQLSTRDHRGVVAEDLRHACNWVATGKVSSSGMDNKETNRVVALFALLTDPWDLTATSAWLHPEAQELESFKAFLRKQAHEGTLRAISRNAFDLSDWESLPMEKLRWLCKQVKNRDARPRRRDPELEPF